MKLERVQVKFYQDTRFTKKIMKQESGANGKKKKPKKMTKGKVRKLLSMTDKCDPPTQRKMAIKLGVHHSTVQKYLKQNGVKLVRKRKVHQLNDEQMKKRRERAPKLMKIIRDNMENIITSDESLFFVPNQKCKRDVCYEKKGEKRKRIFGREERFAKKKVMVWGRITFHGKTELIIIDSNERINSKVYQEKVLTPFLKTGKKKLFGKENCLWHHDSAPCHTSNSTTKFMEVRRLKSITKEEWMPQRPDACPMDFFCLSLHKEEVEREQSFIPDRTQKLFDARLG